MNAVISRLLIDYARPVTLALVHSLWLGSIVTVVAGLLLRTVPRNRSNVRYIICVLALTTVLVGTAVVGVSVGTSSPPHRTPHVVWSERAQNAVETPMAVATGDGASATASLTETGSTSVGAAGSETSVSLTHASESEHGPLSPGARQNDMWSTRLLHLDLGSAGPWIFAGWLAGVLLLALYNLAGWTRARTIARSGIRPFAEQWRRRFLDLSSRIGLERRIEAFESALVDVPTVVGWLRPVLLVPAASFAELSADELELVLIHELAHVRRHDILVNYLQTAVETVFFFHPAVWWLSHNARVEREHCCDDAVVQLTGDRIAYARALTEVEMMRSRVPTFAMGADGGSLAARVRRLAGRTGSADRAYRYPLTGFLVLAALAALAIPALSGIESDASAETLSSIGEATMRGEWRSSRFGDQVKIRFTGESRSNNGWTGTCDMIMDADEFTELDSGDLSLIRDAGTFVLEGGRFPEKWRPCSFIANPSYARSLREFGYEIENEKRLFELAIHDVTLDFARGIAESGYDISLSRLVEFDIHGVTPEYVSGMAAAGYDDLTPSKIVEFRIHGISPDYVREMAAAGYDDLTPSKIVEFRIHGISPEYVRDMAAIGYDEMSASKIVEFRIHGISPEYVRKMAEIGYDDLTPSKIVQFKIHGVSPEYAKAMATLGYDEMSASKIVEFRIHGVSPEYVREMAASGYEDVSPSKMVEFRIHGVTPRYVRELVEEGYGGISASRLVEFRIHGVDADFIRRLRDRGYEDLTPSRIVELKIHGMGYGSRTSSRSSQQV